MNNFDEIADYFINHHILMINKVPHKIVELEFYLFSQDHPDLFCHQNEMQLTTDQWYFHRAGSTLKAKYKGGTFKGLDITFGGSEEYGGILIRSIQVLDGSDKIIEGPCRCVNYILEQCRKKSIEELVSNISLNVYQEDLLYLKKDTLKYDSIPIVLKGPRVGLTFKGKGVEAEKYIFANYRYAIPKCIKKEKWGFFLTTYQLGHHLDNLGFSQTKQRELIQNFNLGKALSQNDRTTHKINEEKSLRDIKDKCICYGYLSSKYNNNLIQIS